MAERIVMPFGKLYTCPKCKYSCNVEWQGSDFEEPTAQIDGAYYDTYKCACGCKFTVEYSVKYIAHAIDD